MYDRLRREISYVEGLLEGSTTGNSPDAKALLRLIGVVDELVEATQKLDIRQAELEEYAEAIDEDLNDLELLVYDDEEDDEDSYLITCPECGEDVAVDLDDLEDEEIDLLCPNCHTTLTIEDASDAETLGDLED
ncbi:CD1247 N-terminal domain-containing protein [Shimazuella kribbensis]|uniref:CD1247 N-terminal domain-containing protein n=1 Tax=Shimazuella kribbensis TaxID=139808 RepID=UPI00040D20BB|nr:CD1247 N-terminal domain-containing protein [Shimazuella kribbensis]